MREGIDGKSPDIRGLRVLCICICMLAIAVGQSLGESVVPVNSKMPEAKAVNRTPPPWVGSTAWKKYRDLFAAARKEKSVPKLERIAMNSLDLNSALEKVMTPKGLSSDLCTFLYEYATFRQEAFRPKRGRRPRPDFMKDARISHGHLKRKFRIVEAFHGLGIKDALVRSFEKQLPQDMEMLSNTLLSAEKDSAHTVSATPGSLQPVPSVDSNLAKSSGRPLVNPPATVEEMQSFTKMVNDSLQSWSAGNQ